MPPLNHEAQVGLERKLNCAPGRTKGLVLCHCQFIMGVILGVTFLTALRAISVPTFAGSYFTSRFGH